MRERVLIVEDETILCDNLCEMLRRAGFDADPCYDGERGLELALRHDYLVVVTDIRLPGMDGIALLRRLVAERPETFVLVTTAYASVESAVEALRLGAYDYLLKPVVFEDLLQKIRNLADVRRLRRQVHELRRRLHGSQRPGDLVGRSEAIERVLSLVRKVGPTTATVLVTGESGTGKELVARAIHAASKHPERDFVAVNLAALPESTVDAQLFGYEKGAFTGADKPREGILRAVGGGTVFLDEIGELPLETQVKLLRALEQHEVLPLGASKPVPVDFRLVAATNRDLQKLVEEGRFRKDLFYRLDVFRIEIPPLRERREDIPVLVEHFLARHGAAVGKPGARVTNEAMRLLMAYDFPGNVRELSNLIERALILSDDAVVRPEHLDALRPAGPPEGEPVGLREAVEQAEKRHILWALQRTGGNREEAARLLQVDRATLYRRLHKYGLDRHGVS